MNDKSWWRIFNILGRIFGIWCGMTSLIFIGWGIGANTYIGIKSTLEIISNQPIYLGVGIFLLIVSVGFITVKPYRPDMKYNGINVINRRYKYKWWTGDHIK